MIKYLTTVGNSKALVIDKAVLQAAGISDETPFQITIEDKGLTIQSVDSLNDEVHKKNVKKIIKKRSRMIKRLSDR